MVAETRISLLNLFQAAFLIIGANLAFFLMVFAVDASINHRVLAEKLARAINLGVVDGRDYPADLSTYADRYTDCVALGLNLVDEPDRNAFGLMKDSEIAKVEGVNACAALMMMIEDKKAVGKMNYGRYWHGYQIFSKPFLRFGDIRDLRYILACLVIGAVFTFSTIVAIRFTGTANGAFRGLWFAGGYLLLTDGANLGNVFTHSLSLLAIFSMPLAVFWAIKTGVKRPLFLMAVAVGSVNAFFDLLFNPPLGLSTLVVATVAASSDENTSARDIIRIIAVVSFGWAVGFFGTYVCRFAIAALLSDAPFTTLQQIFTAGMFRVSGIEEKIEPVMFWATIKNFGYPMLKPSFAVFAVVTAAFMAGLALLGYRAKPRPWLLALLAPAFISVMWFEIFRNHSQHHHFFTYRSASFSLVCLAAAIIFSFSKKHGARETEAPQLRKPSVMQSGELHV
jgi:hypothetical protein